MIPAEQWQKEAGTHAIHCQWADEVYPNVSLDLIKRIQRDAWEQGVMDARTLTYFDLSRILKEGPE